MEAMKLARLAEKMQTISHSPWTVPAFLLAAAMLSYGIFIPWFGLYGDDWIYLYAYHVGGPGFFIDFVAWDRPFSAWIYMLTTPVFGETVWLYHAFLLVLRWLSAVLLWWVLRMVWPKHSRQVAGVAFLFLLYPGFRQQPLPLEFMLHFSSLDLSLLSLGLMGLSLRYLADGRQRSFWILTISAAILTAWGLFPVEYFLGLEALRPVLLWLMLRGRNSRERFLLVLKVWAPYLVAGGIYLIWRVFIFKFPSYQLVDLSGSVWNILAGFGSKILSDMHMVLFDAWGDVFQFPAITSSTLKHYALVAAGFMLVFGLLTFIIRSKGNTSEPRGEDSDAKSYLRRSWGGQALLVGVISLVTAGWPFWLSDVKMVLAYPADRPSLAFMLGVSLVLAGLIDILVHRHFRTLALAVLVGLAVGGHYQNARFFRIEWLNTQSLFWQLSWRAPGLEPGTLLLYDQMRLQTVFDNDLTPALNWMYVPERRSKQIPYRMFDLTLRWQSPNYYGLSEMEEGIPVKHTNRSLEYEGNTSDALALYYNSSACMRLLDEKDKALPDLTDLLVMALPISHPEQIVDQEIPAEPPFMGPEPEHTWCYYFQKAELANQQGDWERVVALGEEAAALSYQPIDMTELIPFIEAHAYLYDWEQAKELSVSAAEADIAFRPAICSAWGRIAGEGEWGKSEQVEINSIKQQSGCDS